jgi:flagellar motor switch protein FliN/FliY
LRVTLVCIEEIKQYRYSTLLKGGIRMADEETLNAQNPGETKAAEAKVTGAEATEAKAAEAGGVEAKIAEDSKAQAKTEAKAAQFSDVQDKGSPNAQKGMDFILDIPLQVTVELGRTHLLVNELLQLGQGSVVELSKLAGEPMEVLVNQKLIARGEVVVVNEKFGIRLTDIISPLERVKQLK